MYGLSEEKYGKLISYKLIGHSVIPVEVKMCKDGLNIDLFQLLKNCPFLLYSREAVVKTPHFSMMG